MASGRTRTLPVTISTGRSLARRARLGHAVPSGHAVGMARRARLRPVLIVTGSVRVRPDAIDEALAASLDHVRRSRTEPGCLRHGVHRDVEDPMRLVFVEQWEDRAALDAHFAVPASGQFVTAVAALAVEPPVLEIWEASPAAGVR